MSAKRGAERASGAVADASATSTRLASVLRSRFFATAAEPAAARSVDWARAPGRRRTVGADNAYDVRS